jgi:hypothetical protein
MSVWLSIMVLASIVDSGSYYTQQSLTPAVDWLNSLIALRGLLLVVSHLFAVPVFSFMCGVGKKVHN